MFKIIPTRDPSWIEFISASPDATIFHHPAWMQNLRDVYGYKDFVVVELEDDKIIAGLPMMEVKNIRGARRLISLPFSDYCMPIGRDAASIEKLTASLVQWSRENDISIEIRNKLPGMEGIKYSQDYVVHSTALDPDPEVVLNNIPHRVRKYIRSAVNSELRVEKGTSEDYLRCFYHQQLLTRRKHGLPAQPWKYFEYLGKNILDKGLGFVLLAFLGDKCLAGRIVLHWGDTLTLKYSASLDDYPHDGRPNYLLVWTAMKWGCEHGYKILDVGRSDIDQMGLRNYKNHWGHKEQVLEYSYIGIEPPRAKMKGLVGEAFTTVMRHSPIWLCQLVGILLYSFFP